MRLASSPPSSATRTGSRIDPRTADTRSLACCAHDGIPGGHSVVGHCRRVAARSGVTAGHPWRLTREIWPIQLDEVVRNFSAS